MTRLLIVFLIGLLVLPMVSAQESGAFYTGTYQNVLAEWGLSEAEIQTRIDQAWQQLFYGDDRNERVYYPVGEDMAYMLDVANKDVRSEGMSYGMMIAVQLDKQEEFNRLWKWAKTYMYNGEGSAYEGFFAWHCLPDGTQIDVNPASDGEVWFVTALFFAAGRWGNGDGIFNYIAEANAILRTMLSEKMFDPETKQVVFVPGGVTGTFTDPSYHQPHYYELWSRWATEDNEFWAEAAAASRAFWQTTAHPVTGLMPNYAQFTGEPQPWGDYGDVFYADAWRNAMNVAVDYAWFAADPWQVEQSNRWLEFFYGLGIGRYNTKFMIDGTPVAPQHRSTGLIAMNATASLAATTEHRWEFVEEFWNTPVPAGQWRYYDGLLYMLALLHLSGNFRIYEPS